MKKWILRIVGILIAAVLIFAGVLHLFHSQIKYNDSMINGNIPGNLYNGGIFCEHNGVVYFANPDDNMMLYSMDPNGTNLKKLNTDMATYINADDHYLYYVRNNERAGINLDFFSFNQNSLCRSDLKGKKIKILDEEPCLYASLFGNQIYYMHYDQKSATSLYKVGIDGKNLKQASSDHPFTCCAIDRYFYYSSPANGKLCRYDTQSDTSTTLLDVNCYKPISSDGTNFYYIDGNTQSLMHANTNSGNIETLTEDKVDCFTVYGSTIYYQRFGDAPALCRVNIGGGDPEVLVSGNYTNLNITSYNLYFMDFQTEEFFYAPLTNPSQVQAFHPGSRK